MRFVVLIIPLFIFFKLNKKLSRRTANFYSIFVFIKLGVSWLTTTSLVVKTSDPLFYASSGMALASGRATEGDRIIIKNAAIQILNAILGYIPGPGSVLLAASLAGTMASLIAYQTISLSIERQGYQSIGFTVATALYPPLLYWNSANLKEPFVTLGFAIAFSSFLRSKYIGAFLGLSLAALFRPQLAALCFIFGVSALILRNARVKTATAALVTLTSFILTIAATFRFESRIRRPQDLGGGSDLQTVWTSRFLWKAFPRTVFATDPWLIPKTPAQLVQILSGVVLTALLLNAIASLRKPTISSVGLLAAVWGTSGCYLLALTVDNAGTLDRYRSPYLVFLLAFIPFAHEKKTHSRRTANSRNLAIRKLPSGKRFFIPRTDQVT